MFNVHPTDSQKVANSIQRDYQKAAANHRLAKDSSFTSNKNVLMQISLSVSVIATAVIVFSQLPH